MNSYTLDQVAARTRFHCGLCGRQLAVQQLDDHAQAHAQRSECLSYADFARACARAMRLEGLPVVLPDGTEAVWPFELGNINQPPPGAGVTATGTEMALA